MEVTHYQYILTSCPRFNAGMKLVELALQTMVELKVTKVTILSLPTIPTNPQMYVLKVTLEADEDNRDALSLYEKFGFYRDEYLPCYYFNGASAFALKLNLR